jgi:hypothetical protein
MSSMLVLEERMRFLVEKENKYLNKIKETQDQFGSMASNGFENLITYCNIKLAQEELTKEIANQQLSKI